MSRDQLLKLLSAAEANPVLRRRLRLVKGWDRWLVEARRLGYGVDGHDLHEAQRQERAARFLSHSQVSPIRPLH